MNIFKLAYKSINWKMGALGGLLMGAVAFYVNLSAGYSAALVPALKQFFYALFVGGSLVRITERISISLEQKVLSIFLALLTPTVITTVLITSIHLFKGTPNPFETILFTTLPTPFGFGVIAFFNRRKYDRKQKHAE